jgi:hypothetical protein
MPGEGPIAYGAVAAMVLYYSSEAQFSVLKDQRSKILYAVYFICSLMTVIVEVVHIIYNPNV